MKSPRRAQALISSFVQVARVLGWCPRQVNTPSESLAAGTPELMLSDGTHRRMVWKERRKDRVGCESRDTAQHTVLYPTLLEYHHILHLGLKKINVVTMKNPEFRTAWERNTVVSLILWTQPLPQSRKPSSGRLCTSKGKTPWIVTTCPRDTLPAVPQMGCCFGSDRGSTPILESDPVLLTVKHLLRTLA